MLCVPSAFSSPLLTTCSAAEPVSVGCLMREPVTTTSLSDCIERLADAGDVSAPAPPGAAFCAGLELESAATPCAASPAVAGPVIASHEVRNAASAALAGNANGPRALALMIM